VDSLNGLIFVDNWYCFLSIMSDSCRIFLMFVFWRVVIWN